MFCLITLSSVEAVVKVGAHLRKHAAAVHGKVFAHPWVLLGALLVLAGEAVASHCGVGLDAHIAKLAMSVLVKVADGGHSDFLKFLFSETVRTFCS
jgi:hypothetical protein